MSRTRDAEASRLRLSEAVFGTLADRGPTGLTLRAVAERAGCTTGLVLHTFRDKRALLLHARDLMHERTRVRSDALEADAPDAGSALCAVLLGALPVDQERLAEARVWVGFLAAALADPVLAQRHAANSRAFAERVTRLIGSAYPDLHADSAERAAALVAAVEGVSSLAAGDPDGWTEARQVAAVRTVILAVTSGSAPEEDLGQGGDMDAPAPDTIHFHQKHHEAIVSGEKVTTVRWNESVAVGAATFVFDGHPTAEPLVGTVTAVHRYRLDTLTAEQAHQPPETDMRRFGQQLRENYYPDMPEDAVVEVAELVLGPT
ncbi:TetR family transcriptional regulator C-terminal domain-containing protein [Curtobacterium sp. CFBP9011]|uniref:TetR family transcriptional regulator C-terminal domain-containing protein n=1 Tax=Curtobacterium sp. CFBP9011 TaxID=3096530 RepID=UPI002A6AF217|nr:TetR family transcriptional regulator C-terminal domain-containing protein [Curtobacterium sp. CFBP9011]MDY1006447.1 TetR family transcriptional regulator C-terminal domain-containing protein [Curtobacterium sp. CFBP9011]